MLDAYRTHAAERAKLGIPPLPLSAVQMTALCGLLQDPPLGEGEFLKSLLVDRVSPGVDPAAKVKAEWLGAVAHGDVASPLVSQDEAIRLLGTMLGGFNVPYLVRELEGPLAAQAATALKHLVLIFDNFSVVAKLAEGGNDYAKAVILSWADAEWFSSRPEIEAEISGVVYKIAGETNTDDLSPAQSAGTRSDIPLHALDMYKVKDAAAIPTLLANEQAGIRTIIVGDVYGTGSSRKSATNSVMWYSGRDIPSVPNKRSAALSVNPRPSPPTSTRAPGRCCSGAQSCSASASSEWYRRVDISSTPSTRMKYAPS